MYEKFILYTSDFGNTEATSSEVVADEGSAGVSESSALLAEESSTQDATEEATTEAVYDTSSDGSGEGSAGASESSALLAEESSAQDATETETTEAVLFEDMEIGSYSVQYCVNYGIVLMTVYVIAWTVLQIFKIIEKRRRTNET